MMQAQQAAMASLPLETQLKLRRASQANFAASLLQLSCSVAIIIMVRYNLESASLGLFTIGGQPAAGATYQCLMATEKWPGACQYAYSVASISILLNFLLSLMQCLTMDCCGMGRLMECIVDAGLIAWWMAAGITLGTNAAQANAQGAPKDGYRNAVVALCWISMVLFALLLLINGYLTAKLGRAYVHAARAARQQQQYGIQMMAPPGGAPGAGGGYPAGGVYFTGPPGSGMPQGAPAWGAPAYGYPAAGPGGWPAPGQVAPPGQVGSGPYAGGPPMTHAVVGAPAAPGAGAPAPAAAAAYPPLGGGAAGPSGGFGPPPAAGQQQQQQQQQQEGGKPLAASEGNYLPGAGR